MQGVPEPNAAGDGMQPVSTDPANTAKMKALQDIYDGLFKKYKAQVSMPGLSRTNCGCHWSGRERHVLDVYTCSQWETDIQTECGLEIHSCAFHVESAQRRC